METKCNPEQREETTQDEMENMYLNFNVGNEIYGIEARYVIQIINMQEITEIPERAPSMKGFINLRGNVIPVVNMRLRFGKTEEEYSDHTCIVVVQVGKKRIGLIVDAIQEAIAIDPESILPPPATGESMDNFYVMGVAKLPNERIAVLIHLNRLFRPGILGGVNMARNLKPVIVAIDDDPFILNFLASVLKKEYDVRLFTSGETALDFLAEQTADLILLDYRMPDMTGFEVLKVLQDDPNTHEIPVIILTGSNDSEKEADALEYGAVDYITKPIWARLLHTRVRLQLELQRYRKNLESLVERRTKSLNAAYDKLEAREEVTLNILAKATDLRDHGTGGHIERTTEFVRVIVNDIMKNPCPGYNISRTEADNLIRSVKLHDLGKISIPDHILLKPGRLTPEEFDLVKKHPISAKQFFSDFIHKMEDSFLTTARDIAYSHHEKWDGTGYPLGLKGEKIPLSARIAAIADVYDALTSVRPYKGAFSHEESVEIILNGSGTHFDPYLIAIFDRHADEFRQITEQLGALIV